MLSISDNVNINIIVNLCKYYKILFIAIFINGSYKFKRFTQQRKAK